MNIVFFSSEVVPFAKTGGLADVCGALPVALAQRGEQISIVMPRYKNLNLVGFPLTKVMADVSMTKLEGKVNVYFIENEKLYGRGKLYGDKNGDYADNLSRFQFFSWKSLELLKHLNIPVDILHCHDWQTALIPAYLKLKFHQDPFFKKTKSILTIHNLAFQGVFPSEQYSYLKLDRKFFTPQGFEFYNQVNLLKGGILYSDCVTTVSPQYAKEIQSKKFGCGLEGVLQSRRDHVVGILNGVDYKIWDPVRDQFIYVPYRSGELKKKYENKKRLQQDLKLPVKSNVPLFGFVSRLAHQKGIDLIVEALDTIMKMDLQMIFIGVGEEKYHKMLEAAAKRYPQRIVCDLKFDEPMAHRVYAGADIFLMPSWYEPCGLSQMISMRYGTLPLVHKTGGLADTVIDIDAPHKCKNGFVFEPYKREAFVRVVKKAVEAYHHKEIFQPLIDNAFKFHCSWDDVAQHYQETYRKCLQSG